MSDDCIYLSGNTENVKVPVELVPIVRQFCSCLVSNATDEADIVAKQKPSGALSAVQWTVKQLADEIHEHNEFISDIAKSPDADKYPICSYDGELLQNSIQVMVAAAELLLLGDADVKIKPIGSLALVDIEAHVSAWLSESFSLSLDMSDIDKQLDPDDYHRDVVYSSFTKTSEGNLDVALTLKSFGKVQSCTFSIPAGSYVWDVYQLYCVAANKLEDDLYSLVNTSGHAVVFRG